MFEQSLINIMILQEELKKVQEELQERVRKRILEKAQEELRPICQLFPPKSITGKTSTIRQPDTEFEKVESHAELPETTPFNTHRTVDVEDYIASRLIGDDEIATMNSDQLNQFIDNMAQNFARALEQGMAKQLLAALTADVPGTNAQGPTTYTFPAATNIIPLNDATFGKQPGDTRMSTYQVLAAMNKLNSGGHILCLLSTNSYINLCMDPLAASLLISSEKTMATERLSQWAGVTFYPLPNKLFPVGTHYGQANSQLVYFVDPNYIRCYVNDVNDPPRVEPHVEVCRDKQATTTMRVRVQISFGWIRLAESAVVIAAVRNDGQDFVPAATSTTFKSQAA